MRPVGPDEELRRATLEYLAEGHPVLYAPDEEVHPYRLDPAARELELALRRYEEWKKKGESAARGAHGKE